MKPCLLGLCVLALTVGANGQEGSRAVYVRPAAILLTASQVQGGVIRTRILPTGRTEKYEVVIAKGVEVRLGSAVLTADEAEYSLKTTATDQPTDVLLRGNVRLNGTVELARTILR